MEQMSPLAMTGRFTASLTLRINDQSAVPLYIWQRVRPWTVISCAPRSSAIWASSGRSEEHTSELQSLMRISYAVFCLKKKKIKSYQQLVKLKKTSNHNNIETMTS